MEARNRGNFITGLIIVNNKHCFMKVTKLLIVIFLISPIFVSAQKSESTMDRLRATTWWNGPLPKWVSYMKFSKTKCMFTTKYEG